jgi:hypothetical protein
VAARFEIRQVYDHPAHELIELLNDPSFLEQKARDFGAIDAKASFKTDAGGIVVATIDVWEKSRIPGKDTDHRTLTQRTDPNTLRGTWTQVVHGFEDRSKAEGTTEMRNLGEQRCKLITRGMIEIRVPVMGKVIEKKICEGVEANSAKEQRYIAAALARRFG